MVKLLLGEEYKLGSDVIFELDNIFGEYPKNNLYSEYEKMKANTN